MACSLFAAVTPDPPGPPLAPPAASTMVTMPEVVLPPTWPIAVAGPLMLTTVPVLVSVVVLVPLPFLMVFVTVPMPSPCALPESASAKSPFHEPTSCSLLARVLPPMPEAAFPLPAASTVPTEPVVELLPIWPMAAAAPLVLAAVPVFVTVLVLVPLPLVMELLAELSPSPQALPLSASAKSALPEPTHWPLLAEMPPSLPLPPLPPPAASTIPTLPLVVLPPTWPLAMAAPDVLATVPLFVTVLVLRVVALAELLPPVVWPPVVREPKPLLVMVLTTVPTPSPEASPLLAEAPSQFSESTDCQLLAETPPLPPLAPPPVLLALPELAPPAASTVPTVPDVLLLPIWPAAVAAPLTLVAVPVFVTVLVLVEVPLTLLLAPVSAPPEVRAPLALLVMLVDAALSPSPRASPVDAHAPSPFSASMSWEFCAVIGPLALLAWAEALPVVGMSATTSSGVPPLLAVAVAEALPELAPPAASTSVTEPVVVLPPTWPMAAAAPVVLATVPELVTVLVLDSVALMEELAPFLAPPEVSDPVPPLLMRVLAEPMPSPEASPLEAPAMSQFSELTSWSFRAVTAPLVELAPAMALAGFRDVPVAVAVALALPEFEPPAASTVPTVPVVLLLPD